PIGQTTGPNQSGLERKFNGTGTLVASLIDSGIDVADLTPQDGPGSYTVPVSGDWDEDVDAAGRTLAYLRFDDQDGLTARVLDLASRQFRPFTIHVDGTPAGGADGGATAISANGRTLTTIDFEGRTRRWDAVTGARRDFAYQARGELPAAARESPDGRVL